MRRSHGGYNFKNNLQTRRRSLTPVNKSQLRAANNVKTRLLSGRRKTNNQYKSSNKINRQ